MSQPRRSQLDVYSLF